MALVRIVAERTIAEVRDTWSLRGFLVKQSHQVGPFDSRKGSVDEMPVAQKKIAETSIWRRQPRSGGRWPGKNARRKAPRAARGQRCSSWREAIWRLTSARLPRACARLTGRFS